MLALKNSNDFKYLSQKPLKKYKFKTNLHFFIYKDVVLKILLYCFHLKVSTSKTNENHSDFFLKDIFLPIFFREFVKGKKIRYP